MNHGSLFSGIGGFDLAAQRMGWNNVFHCEIDDFCKKILTYYWPEAISYGDIKQTDFTIQRGHIDVLTGGFPCQPYSHAGKQLGDEDDRHLWPEMLRAIREIQPTWIVGENVRGIISWNAGMVFEQVHSDLEAEGYETFAFLLPAAGVGAPHERYRTWFIAHSKEGRSGGLRNARKEKGTQSGDELSGEQHRFHGKERTIADTDFSELQGSEFKRGAGEQGQTKGEGRHVGGSVRGQWEDFPSQSPICSRDDGISLRLDGITFSKWRTNSLQGFGNAVVPQLVMQIFKTISEYELKK